MNSHHPQHTQAGDSKSRSLSPATDAPDTQTWGGAREGAGRPSTGRKAHKYYVTEEEDLKIKQFIKELRGPSE